MIGKAGVFPGLHVHALHPAIALPLLLPHSSDALTRRRRSPSGTSPHAVTEVEVLVEKRRNTKRLHV